MTSKNLFTELMKENAKRRIWAAALSVLGFFFAFPVYTALVLNTWNYRLSYKGTTVNDIILAFSQKVAGFGSTPLICMIIGLAVLNGLQGMAHLHSRTQMDLYGSVPVKRNKLFAVSYLNGVLIFAIPYLLFLIISMIMGGASGYINASTIGVAAGTFCCALILYLCIYTVVILAGILTGNTIVTVLGAAVMLTWGAVIGLINQMYMIGFFKTYYNASGIGYSSNGNPCAYIYSSPVFALLSFMNAEKNTVLVSMAGGIYLPSAVIGAVTVLLIVLCVVLYNKYPSEAAGHAISFKVTRPFIKVIIMIPTALAAGILFQSAGSETENSLIWMIFGIVIGLVLSQAVIEIIYDFDFKACIRHLISFGIGAAAAAFILCYFVFDLGGYDRYVPKASDVSSAAFSGSELQSSLNITDDTGYYLDSDQYRLNGMKLKDIDDVIQIAENGIDYAASFAHVQELYSAADRSYVIVRYNLNSGRSVYRQYYVDFSDDAVFKAYDSMYATKEYKDAVYPILTAEDSIIKNLYYKSPNFSEKIKIKDADIAKLLDTYKTELYMQNADDLKEEVPVGDIVSHFKGIYDTYPESYTEKNDWLIYPSFTKTIALLKGYGIDVYSYLDTDDMTQIDVSYYDSNSETGYSADELYSDPDQMKQIIDSCVPSDYLYTNSALYKKSDDSYSVTATYNELDEYDNNISASLSFIKDKVPQFVQDDVAADEK